MHPRDWAWIVVAVATLALTGALVAWTGGWDFDRTAYWASQMGWFLEQNDALSRWPATVWFNVTLLGDGSVLLAILSPLAVLGVRSWASLVAAAPFAGAMSAAVKAAAATPRPAAVIDPADFAVVGESLAGSNSFPSGHAITVFAAAGAIVASSGAVAGARWQGWVTVLTTLAVAGAVGLSRVAVGAHWPLDVLGGAGLGWLAGVAGFAVVRVCPGWERCLGSDTSRQVVAAVMLVISAVACFRALDGSMPHFPASLWVAALSSLMTCACLSNRWRPPAGRAA